MQTDKNTVIGFVLLGILFIGYFWFSSQQQQALLKEQRLREDSIAQVRTTQMPVMDTIAVRLDSARRDSIQKINAAGNFQTAAIGTEEFTTIENNLLKIVFTNKGAQPKSIELKNYKSFDSTNVILAGTDFDNISYNINTASQQSAPTSSLFFQAPVISKGADGSQVVTYQLASQAGQSIVHQFVIRPNDYLVDWNLVMEGSSQLLSQNALNIQWQVQTHRQQRDIRYERTQSRLCYVEDNDYDFSTATSNTSETFNKQVHWLSVKQQFFNATLIAKNQFTSGNVSIVVPDDSTDIVGQSTANLNMQLPVSAGASVTVPMQLYYGPNDYHVLKQYNMQMESIVDLGSGVFSFVKYINRYIVMPVFDFLSGFISSYGWVIALLTIFIRLVTSPLTYSSYLSGAKMKVLRPELDTLKKKFGDDQQGFAMEQMKLFREAGVNPLGGCIPALLQIPIFFALYSFFNAEIQLRGESFACNCISLSNI